MISVAMRNMEIVVESMNLPQVAATYHILLRPDPDNYTHWFRKYSRPRRCTDTRNSLQHPSCIPVKNNRSCIRAESKVS